MGERGLKRCGSGRVKKIGRGGGVEVGEKGLKIGRGKGVNGENDVGEKGLKIGRGEGLKGKMTWERRG